MAGKTDIAVIGMACRFPGASNPEAFWENLKAGISAIEVVPGDRWKWEDYWGDPQTEKNKSNSKWGGFLTAVDCFDNDFFGLSATEVERMDPQQRIMLELTWSCLEDAGVRPSALSGKKVGVFVGVFNFDYKELQERSGQFSIEAHHSTGTASAIIANRISYYYNFKGPSFPIDTACSSSLNALHASVQSLLQGECSVAVAGGINLLLTPTRHISFSKTGMLSPTGSCKTFDDSADGYVRGEGAGLVLLKPLEKALADNDNIYGIIKGSAVNHGGKTYSLTYPSQEAQQEVILQAQAMAGITPDSISYVEAHGTGTPKGDPIEFQALTNAFRTKLTEDKKNYCGLGSVKTNIGHLEAAAGIAGVIKVLLSMRHQQLPGLHNFRQLNHRIAMDNAPFYLVTQLQEWVPLQDAQDNILPRRAGVSSFGFGGTNAHVILEEAPPVQPAAIEENSRQPYYYLVCLSAKTDKNLLQKKKDLLAWLQDNRTTVSINDIARTLAAGREHFQKRTILIVHDIQSLAEKLEALINTQPVEGGYSNIGVDKKDESLQHLFTEIADHIAATLNSALTDRDTWYNKLAVLAELYVKGYNPDWEQPWFGSNGRRISLPVYPFTRTSFWLPEIKAPVTTTGKVNGQAMLHPLLGSNISDFDGQKFSTRFTGNEFFIKDHVVKGKQLLPAVAYLEMVRAAVMESVTERGEDQAILCLKNIIWTKPVTVASVPTAVQVTLIEEEEDLIYFDVNNGATNEEEHIIYSQGVAAFELLKEQAGIHISGLLQGNYQQVWNKEQSYAALTQMGFAYGPGHQSVEAVYAGGLQHLAKLVLPAGITDTSDEYLLHPSLLDGALQAALVVGSVNEPSLRGMYLPFALDRIEIWSPCTADMWAVIRTTNNEAANAPVKRMDIDLVDKTGKLCVRMQGICFKLLEEEQHKEQFLLFTPQWQEKPLHTGQPAVPYSQRLLVVCEPGDVINEHALQQQLPGVRLLLLQGASENAGQRFCNYTRKLFEEIQVLLQQKPQGATLIQVAICRPEEADLLSGVLGLLRTLSIEHPAVTAQLIEIGKEHDLSAVIKENEFAIGDDLIRYTNGKRQVATWKELPASPATVAPWKEGGVYLITGGAGGLGLIMANEIAAQTKNVRLVLTGRSPLSEAGNERVAALRTAGVQVDYHQLDVSDKRALGSFIQHIHANYKGLHGIIHSAGVIKDDFVIRKSKESVQEVLSPKVLGATYLDAATKDIPLDFFILFSSIVGPLGNTGQADYAAANAFLDGFANWRNQQVQLNNRHGQTLAINWPLWKEGGMQLSAAMQEAFRRQMHMEALDTSDGIKALYQCMQAGVAQVLVAPGHAANIRSRLLKRVDAPIAVTQAPAVAPVALPEDGVPEQQAIAYFKQLLSGALKRPVEQIAADAPMEEYGIDSIMVMQLTNQLETVFGSLPKTLFFEYQNIQDLTGYFLTRYAEKLRQLLQPEQPVVHTGAHNNEQEAPAIPVPPINDVVNRSLRSQPRVQPRKKARVEQEASAPLDIAIIGLAGRYPQADNLQEFWNNLANGKDCITEIPADRWDYRLYFDEDKEKEGTSYSKWGGFLNDVDKFDPLFFNISPLEAERMDPQERLFLQCVYETIEDAGYTRHSLTTGKKFGLGNQVGVFVGVMYEEYQLYGAEEVLQGRPVALWGLPSSIANRVSYFCDFHGPSMAIDTMCSSSLTAIHLACESIVRGNCEVAVAGGVNVSVHPNKYIFLSQGRFASSKGRCESFGTGGDGYVPGEGVGAVLLKPLHKAVADGDHIYGVIKSTAINHGGKTNGYTVPNPKAQAGAIAHAFKEAGINPRTISYIEAHGTGTSLGDPIEIAGLSRAMEEYTNDRQFCAIGSVKSNIGHCESAAGIAGLTKILLQLQHQQIVPSLHSATLNEHIDFSASPFVVQQGLSEWRRPVIGKNGQAREYARCAGISSFGAGGANAHIVIEEYTPADSFSAAPVQQNEPELIVLSAVEADRLQEKAKQLLAAIRGGNSYWHIASKPLRTIAYTLQVGREQLEHRLALVVHTVEELAHKLDAFVQGKQKKLPGVYEGVGSIRKTAATTISNDNNIATWLTEKQYERIAEWWVKGAVINWNDLYKNGRAPQRISMPVYPFKKERYWIERPADQPGAFQNPEKQTSFIHPLLHENITDLTGQRFKVTFTGQEFFLKDHVIKDRKVLPAAAYLEMVREAVWQSVKSLAVDPLPIQIQQVSWQQPLIVAHEHRSIVIELYAEENGEIIFEVCGADAQDATDVVVFCAGTAVISQPHEPAAVGVAGITSIIQQCTRSVFRKKCYETFEQIGFQYGHTHRGLEEIHVGHNRLMAKVAGSTLAFDKKEHFILHPGLLDAALQATLWWNATEDQPLQLMLPVAVETVQVFRAIPAVNWVSVSNSSNTTVDPNKRLLDIDILTEEGVCCVRLQSVTLQAPTANWLSGSTENKYATWLLLPEWKEKEAVIASAGNPFSKHVVVAGGLPAMENALEAELPEAEVMALEARQPDEFTSNSLRVFEKVQTLLKAKEKGRMLLQVLIPADEDNMYAGLRGLLRTAHKENPAFVGQVIRIAAEDTVREVKQRLQQNMGMLTDTAIRYHKGKREVQEWTIPNEQVQQLVELGNRPWKDRGVYLITGGAGGLGFIFAKEIAITIKHATLVLTGRSAPDNKIQEKIQALQQAGATVVYKRTDVTDRAQVQALVRSVKDELGSINGIIHSAGVLRDNYIINKTTAEWNEVLAPKIKGTQYLDDATRGEPLDFFVFFSSVTGAVGNAGQADYATANAFMDEWAVYRNSLVAKGLRRGHTLSINWPLWEEGGMTVGKEAQDHLFESMGMVPLPAQEGIAALYGAFQSKQSQVMVIKGDRQRINTMIVQPEEVAPTKTTPQHTEATTGGQAPEAVFDYFRKLLSSVIRLPVEKIRQDVAMEQYGIDSVMVMKMTGKLEKVFGTLSKTLFFEYQTIQQLAAYFWEEHKEKIQEVCGLQQAVRANVTAVQPNATKGLAALLKAARPARRTPLPVNTTIQPAAKKAAGPLDIAIVGVAGKYPQADNLEAFWQNLVNGKDCVTEIPATRWDLNLFYDADKSKAGKTYSKWGGFINGVDEFDPLFFNISPREAELMDPQERLFLQCAYQTMEDAGYNRETIATGEGEAMDRSVGVYVGVMYEEYQLYGLQENEKGNRTALFSIASSIANRVSYFYNFNGPSIAVDTMCSSSLTAIHLACQAIQNGDCRAAIAGGVNVSIHPNKYLLLAQGKFISGKGRCEAFGIGGEGYVPAEGVGAVLLKPLAQALEDGDHVYGIIKATAINHGGKTNGYTVPNPNAQAAVIKKAYQRAGVDPRTISYVEAHGTGTALGDPIEITGLKKAFREFTADNRFCAIGSVKSNMGHAESAAGIAGLTKILLQLKHKQLAPSLHSQVLNPHIDFDSSPFVVQQQLAEWKRPVFVQNGKTVEGVRRAALSSFGAGGANAHIIIEEADSQWAAPVPVQPQHQAETEPVIVLLSAKNDSTLHLLAQQLLDAVQVQRLQDKDLVNLAFTLQAGRDALETRLALVVRSITELTERLTAFINNEENIEGLFHGRIERDTPTITLFTDDQELQEAIGKWIERKKYSRLSQVWVKGVAVNWMQLYSSQPVKPRRISLPGYLFAKEKYWAPNGNPAYVTAMEQPKMMVRQPEPVAVPPQEEPYQLLTYEELWLEQSITQAMANRKSTHAPGIKRVVCLLSDANRQAQLVQAFRLTDSSVQVHFITGNELDTAAGVTAYRHAIRSIVDAHGAIDAFLYLWGLENDTMVSNYQPIVYLLQAIGAEKLRNNQVLLAGQWNTTGASLNKCYFESWLGFARSARLSLPSTQVLAIYYEGSNDEAAWNHYATWWWNELQLNQSHEALYKNGKRYITGTRTTQIAKLPGLLKQGGTYLITGGAGGLGLVFAEYLSTQYKANLVLTGRSILTAQKQLRLDTLRRNGSQVMYLQADVCDSGKMTAGLALVRQEMGVINGVLHAAGIEEEGSIVDRSIQQFEKVLGPKVAGTLLLDEWLQAEPLDFVCYFSSLSAMLGDFGTCDYAVGNRFQMAFAAYRAQLQQAGLRSGKTIAINWPLWKEGGMTFTQAEGADMYLRSSGQRYLETAEGTEVFNRLLTTGAPVHQVVIPGKASKVNPYLKVVSSPSVERANANGHTLEEQMHGEIIQLVSDVLKMSTDRIDIQDNLADLGFDSVTLTYFSDVLARRLSIDVVPALFFSYPTIEKLTRYFIKEHAAKITAVYNTVHNAPQRIAAPVLPPVEAVIPEKKDPPPMTSTFEPIAIIGMSGRFPQARNIEEMWKILEEGRNAVTEIAPDRFDWRAFYDKENIEEGKTNCKWTGHIPGIREFDPLFFELSPAEARDMDPRQRLLLQEGWKALEDAGYGKVQLEKNRIALYVGVEEGFYASLTKQAPALTSNHNAVLAARLSYFLNFDGPNMAINTACSSGLVAAHQAFMSLQQGECDTAVAAAVNLLFTPEPYVMMSQAGMLSDDGTCHTFDRNANGMVPGEAVTVVVMKRLSKAIADGDPIYATIAGSGINYDGKTNGITAPGGLAQTALLQSIYNKYRLDPAQIEYIVTHGTGTKLGDPVEINALRDAFKAYTNKEQYCALTSAKTNFGHTFAASGLVSLISLVQALRHEKIPASLHCVQENEYIARDNSPFYINKALRAWPAVPGKIRTGGVSAFGMSGTNAHMVVQSYDPVARGNSTYRQPYYLLLFSAKTKEALQQRLQDMLPVLAQRDEATMAQISYTLMAGRHHFKHRCAVVAADQQEALQILERVISGTPDNNKYAAGVAAKLNREGEMAIQELGAMYQYSTGDGERQRTLLLDIAQWYCKGYALEWDALFPAGTPARIHLPTYPFERKEYWVQTDHDKAEKVKTVSQETAIKATAVSAPKQWLFVKEELVAAPLPANIDWNNRLSRFEGKSITVVYFREEDKNTLLHELDTVRGSLTIPLSLTMLAADTMSVSAIKAMKPDVVLIAGATDATDATPVSRQPIEQDVAPVYRLIKCLMETAWEEPVRLYFIYESREQSPRLDYEALSGLLRSAMKENEQHTWKLIRLCDAYDRAQRCRLLLQEWLADDDPAYTEVIYQHGSRLLQQLVTTTLPLAYTPAFRKQGNYIIAGGTGYIGSLLVQQIAAHYGANLFILGRSKYTAAIQQQCEAWQRSGAHVHYFSTDVTDWDQLQQTYEKIKSIAGSIHGVINLARAHDTNIIAAKTWQSFFNVSLTKIRSTQYLDELTKEEPLDFFMLFSSMASFGASGESDYSYSCAFQNAFARNRDRLRVQGQRSGKSVAQCWGPWDADQLFPDHRQKWVRFGCDFIDMNSAFPVIEATVVSDDAVIGINAVVDADKIKNWFNIDATPVTPAVASVAAPDLEQLVQQWEQRQQQGRGPSFDEISKTISIDELHYMEAALVERIYNLCVEPQTPPVKEAGQPAITPEALTTIETIKTAIMEVLAIDQLDESIPFTQYGMDSIKTMKLCARLRKKLLTDVQPQLFIAFPTLQSLSAHIITTPTLSV